MKTEKSKLKAQQEQLDIPVVSGSNHPCPTIKKLLNETGEFYCHSWDNDDLRCKEQCDKCKGGEFTALDGLDYCH